MMPELKQLYLMCINSKIVKFNLQREENLQGLTLFVSTIGANGNIQRGAFDGSWMAGIERVSKYKMVYAGTIDNNDNEKHEQ